MKKTVRILLLLLTIIIINIIVTPNTVRGFRVYSADYISGASSSDLENKGIGPSVLTANKNVYCEDKSKDNWQHYPSEGINAYFRVSQLKTIKNTKTAFVLSKDKITFTTTNWSMGQLAHRNSVSQNVFWYFCHSSYNRVTGFQELYNQATDFENYKKNFVELKQMETTVSEPTVNSNGYTVIGPYKIQFTQNSSFGKLTSIVLNGTISGSNSNLVKDTDYYLSSDSSGSKIIAEPTTDTSFYIVIKNGNVEKVNTLTIKQKQITDLTVKYYECTPKSNSNGQPFVVVDSKSGGKETTKTLTISINKTIIKPFDFTLNKTNFDGKEKLSGVTFQIKLGNVRSLKINGTTVNTSGAGSSLGNGVLYNASGNNITLTGVKTNSNGKIEIKDVISKSLTEAVSIDIEETATLEGYQLLPEPISLKATYTSGDWKLSLNSTKLDSEYYSVNGTNIELNLKNRKIPKIKIGGSVGGTNYGFDKIAASTGETVYVNGVEFKATFEQGGKTIATKTATSRNGNVSFEEVQPLEISDVKVTIEEIKIPEGWTGDFSTEIIFKYDKSSETWKASGEGKIDTKLDDNTVYVKIEDVENNAVIEELNIIKTDSEDKTLKVAGAIFDMELSNVLKATVNGNPSESESGTISLKEITTDKEGNIKLEDVVIKDLAQDVTIELDESKAPKGYKKIEGTVNLSIKVNISGDTRTYTVTTNNSDLSEIDQKYIETNTKTVSGTSAVEIGINNMPIISIGGIVWEDTQSYHKDIKGPDGILNNNEEGIPGIGVRIYNIEDEKYEETDVYGYELMTETANEGQSKYPIVEKDSNRHVYNLNGEKNNQIKYILNDGNEKTEDLINGQYIFPNLKKGNYRIEFTYDGINYQTVECSTNTYKLTSPKESKVEEQDRTEFNNKFETISKGESNDGTTLGYDYDEEKQISKLKTTIKGENPKNGNNPDFQMTAISKNYLKAGDSNWGEVWNDDGTINREHYALDVNCGLTEKFFDLALGTDVKSAKVKINGKETEYNYAQIMDGALEDDLTLDGKTQNNSSEQGTEYTLYLYESDYNFRIDDYKTDKTEEIKNNVNTDDNKTVNENKNKEDELEVYVTYSIILKNQSKQDGRVETFDYYYDSKYSLVDSSDYTLVKNKETKTYETVKIKEGNIQGKYEAVNNEDEHKIEFKNIGGTNLKENNNYYREEIEVTFKVNKKDNRALCIKNDKEEYETFSNVGEITSYSTPSGGFIDYDSAPGNANVTFENGTPKVGQYEDDTDEAPGIKISVKENLVREISGNVFEDANKDGIKDGEDAINDVIVQLIEIKTIKGDNYEYIWQETRSGSNQVTTTTRNGYTGAGYENSVTSSDTGKYEFKDFIPGNYIVRFIYGDGRTYDLTDNIKKYNGQDYKSTIDKNYKEEWYDSTKYKPNASNSSVAVDNEGRRLEVIAYSTTIDFAIGTAINNKTEDMLKATWMCAETSKIYVPVDTGVGTDTTGDSNKIMFNTRTEPETELKLENINFGLALRPNTKLVLEKHITSLKITPQGVGVQPIVEARLDIDKILEGVVGSSDAEGIRTGLSIIKSTRDERGFWKVETDIEELAQGAKVELEYTYVIKNEGDEDYLSSDVIGEYTTNIGKDKNSNGTDDYVDYLKGASETAKASVKGQRNNSGSYLGQYYYTGTKGTNDESVLSTVTKIEDNLNNNLKFVNTTNPSFTSKNGGEKVVYDANGNDNKETIETVLENIESFATLEIEKRDTSKTAKLETTLSASSKEIAYPTYIGEITEYTNAAGRKDMKSTPENLSYVHSEATNKTMNTDNEVDEFWGEKLIVSKPTGEDKQAPVQAIIIATTAIATIGIGIILIKKFVLKK